MKIISKLNTLSINSIFLDKKKLFNVNTLNVKYLLENYSIFIKSIKKNKGLFWPPGTNIKLSDKDFLFWFSGFVDAEGMFYIYTDKRRPSSHSFRFEIGLHTGDLPVLNYIKERLKFGTITICKNAVTYSVTKLIDIKTIISIFENHPLLTHKQLDFSDFKYIYNLRNKNLHNYQLNDSKVKKLITKHFISTYEEVILIKRRMNKKRTDFSEYIIPKYTDINPYWLVGFVEGDGSFYISRGKAAFSITQKSDIILNIIKDYFVNVIGTKQLQLKSKNKLYLPIANIDCTKVNYHKRKKNDKDYNMYSISNQDVLFQYVAPFFANKQFLTKKGYDFFMWLICLHLIIQGYTSKPEGRILLWKIKENMNKPRCTNNNIVIYNYSSIHELINSVFCQKPLFDIFTGLSHHRLSLLATVAETRGKGKTIYVYKNKVEITGSPFSSYAKLSESLNLSVKSIKSYLDTEIEMKGYLLYSNPKH
jgi:LAGLIDADG endonuclease